jgi:hypothetical protein
MPQEDSGPGSGRIRRLRSVGKGDWEPELARAGDERNALLMLTVEADFGAGKATLPGARLYLRDDNGKIKTEHVIFYAAQN